jgi:hypothetical protein
MFEESLKSLRANCNNQLEILKIITVMPTCNNKVSKDTHDNSCPDCLEIKSFLQEKAQSLIPCFETKQHTNNNWFPRDLFKKMLMTGLQEAILNKDPIKAQQIIDTIKEIQKVMGDLILFYSLQESDILLLLKTSVNTLPQLDILFKVLIFFIKNAKVLLSRF